MRFTRNTFFTVLFVCFALSVLAEESPLASQKLTQALVDEVSGEIAFNYTVLISHYDRIQASEGWHNSAVMIKKELEKRRYTDATIKGWPAQCSRYCKSCFRRIWLRRPE